MQKKHMVVLGVALLTLMYASVVQAASSLDADVIEYDFRNGQAIATGNVLLTNDDGKATAKAAEYNTKTGNGKLTGSVVADKGDSHLTCNMLNLADAGDHLTAVGNSVLKNQDKTLRADQVEYYSKRQYAETVGSWARLALDDGSTLDAAKLNYNMAEGLAHAQGNVRIVSPPRKLTARADQAIYNTKADDGTVELIGNATATQDGNTVRGNTLTLKGTGGKVAIAEGNVKLYYVPKPTPPAPAPIVDEKGAQNYKETRVASWPGQTVKVGTTELA